MYLRSSVRLSLVIAIALGLLSTPTAQADDSATDIKYQQSVDKAVAFLSAKAQAADGSFNAQAGPAVTALATTAILRHGRSPAEPVVAKGLKYLEGFVREDGGVYAEESYYKNYETCLAILCFTEANRNGKYDDLIKKADAFVKDNQWGSAGDKGPQDFEYGGAGYGKNKRPDLSNTSFLVDALKAAGNDENSAAMQRALLFVSRCQNLESKDNTTPFAAKVNDGGFYYTPAAGGVSQAGTDEATGGLRSYASMTYA